MKNFQQSPKQFRKDIAKAKKQLNQKGAQAPAWIINKTWDEMRHVRNLSDPRVISNF